MKAYSCLSCAVHILSGTSMGTTQVNLGTAYPTDYRSQRSLGITCVIFTIEKFTFSCCVVMTLCHAPVNQHEALVAGVVHCYTVHIHVLIRDRVL